MVLFVLNFGSEKKFLFILHVSLFLSLSCEMRFGAIFIVCDLFVVIASVIQLITLQAFKEGYSLLWGTHNIRKIGQGNGRTVTGNLKL